MGSKKKMAIAISSVAILILAVIIGVVAVLAAQQVSIKSSVNISYTAGANVKGSISATYKTEKVTNGNLGSKPFDGSETGTPNESLGGISELKLGQDGEGNWVEFTFTFENTSTTSKYTSTLAFTDGATGNGTILNMKLEGAKDNAEFSTINTSDLTQLITFDVAKNTTVEFKLKVSVAAASEDASFIGTLLWNLVAERV